MGLGNKLWNIWLNKYEFDSAGERLIYKMLRLFQSGNKLNRWRAWFLCNKLREKYTCKVYPSTQVAPSTKFVHVIGVTLGKTAIVGERCQIYSNAVVVASVKGDVKGEAKRRHAMIGDDCVLGDGCMLIGAITIGNDCFIGARAIVTHDVPPHSVVIGTNVVRPKRPEEVNERYRSELGINL